MQFTVFKLYIFPQNVIQITKKIASKNSPQNKGGKNEKKVVKIKDGINVSTPLFTRLCTNTTHPPVIIVLKAHCVPWFWHTYLYGILLYLFTRGYIYLYASRFASEQWEIGCGFHLN